MRLRRAWRRAYGAHGLSARRDSTVYFSYCILLRVFYFVYFSYSYPPPPIVTLRLAVFRSQIPILLREGGTFVVTRRGGGLFFISREREIFLISY